MASLHAEAIAPPATATWSTDTVLALFELLFPELLYRATPLHGTARLDPLELRAPIRWACADVRRGAGALLPRGRQFHLLQ